MFFHYLPQYLPFTQRSRQDMIEGVAPVRDVFVGVDEDVGRNVKFRQGMVEPHHLLAPAPFRPERFGFNHDQVDIRILARVASPTRAEEDDLLGIDFVDDGPDHTVQKCIGDRRLAGGWLHHSLVVGCDSGVRFGMTSGHPVFL